MSDFSPPPEEPEPPKPSRRRRIVKWTVVSLIVLAAFVALLPTILSTSLAKDVILGWLADNVARKVEFSKLDVSWGHGIRLEGLKVSDAGEPGEPLLEAPLVEIDAPLLPLLFKRVNVRRFTVVDPVLHVTRRSDTATNTDDVLKTRRVRRRHRADGGSPKGTAQEPEEESVLPEIHVPLEVKNLTIVFRDRKGREARKSGIAFTGNLDTRDGPTTFDLTMPSGAGSGLRFQGNAVLFEPDGTLLTAAERKVDATLVVTRVDAAENRDLLRLFAGETPVAGVLDGKIETHLVGRDAKGDVDLRLSHLGYGDAAKDAAARQGDDLTVSGRFEMSRRTFRLDAWKVRAAGLVIDADLSGGLDAAEGKASVDADLGRMTGALRAIGVELKGALAGRLSGSVLFTPSPSKGTGDFSLTGFRAEGFVEGRPPVAVDDARIQFTVVPSKERIDVTSLVVKLADVVATAHGTRAADGTLDISADAKGDLGGLLARVRDLGFLPGGFAVNGAIDAQVHVTGTTDALVVDLPRVVLSEKDARIEASGARAADGSLDGRASGSGDLGALFGRAAAAGAGPQGLSDVKGRFAFEATVKGTAAALELDVPKLHVDGDLNLEAHGRLAADGTIDAQVDDLSGRVNDVLLLLRRMAILDRDVTLEGRLAATASVKGTREKPEVPHATLKLTGGPIAADVSGSVASTGALAADATISGDLAAVVDIARRAGLVDRPIPVTGQFTVRARAAGTREKIDVPEFRVTVVNGTADVDVTGRYGADRSISATVNVSGDVDRAVLCARDAGFLKRAATTGCKYTLRASASGTTDEIEVPSAQFAMTGPLRLDADGHFDARRNFAGSGRIAGAVQPLLDLAGAWSGEESRSLDGTISGSFAAEGRPDRFDLRVPAINVRARGVAMDADATRAADGTARANVKVAGPIADLLDLARAFGVATDVNAKGELDASVSGSLAGRKAEASVAIVATDLVVSKPKVNGGAFREPRLALSVPAAKYDLDAKSLAPMKAQVTLEGAQLDGVAQTVAGSAGDVFSFDGKLAADEKFARNHPELLSGASFRKIAGPLQFQGDVSKGRENAAGWTGGFLFEAEGVTAPHVNLSTAKLPGKLAGGVLTIDPIQAVLNDGPVTGTATIGLVGDAPAHHLVLSGKDVSLDTDLAPLVARASPLFAIGEDGKTGGKASLDLDLRANGFDSATIKKTMTGGGTVGLTDAYVQSSRAWVGELMQFLGSSDRLTIAPVKIPFKVKDSKVETGEIPIDGAGLAIRLGGNAGLDGALDYLLRVKTAGGGGILTKFASLLDKDGFLPLRLGGTVSKPKLKLPDWKDALKSGLGDLLGGKKDPPKPQMKDEPKKKKPKPEDPPPPPPPSGDPPPPPPPGDKQDDPPPPPPPSDKKDDPPPPPPPGEKKDGPPPPPPPK